MSNSAPSTSDDRPKTRLLLVDDHAIMRHGLAAIVNEEPDLHVCAEAESAEEAMRLLVTTPVDLAVVDISLKHSDGLELVKQIASCYPHVLSLVLSMYEESVYAERALRAGARGYVRKVEAAETVLTAIRRVLQGQPYVSDSVAEALVNRVAAAGGRANIGVGVEALSDRELQVLRHVGRGMSSREIADDLCISVKTVETHREHVKRKLNLPTAGDLLRYAIEFMRVHG
jgi:DNA-binding NarL/FixJ family response regulator